MAEVKLMIIHSITFTVRYLIRTTLSMQLDNNFYSKFKEELEFRTERNEVEVCIVLFYK